MPPNAMKGDNPQDDYQQQQPLSSSTFLGMKGELPVAALNEKNFNNSTIEESSATSSLYQTPGQKSNALIRNTFHWELNFYTACFLSFIYYYCIPVDQRIVMKCIFGLLALDATKYYYYKGTTPGCPYTVPFVSLIAMIVAPVRFWAEMANIAIESGEGICTNTLVGHFMVFVTDVGLCRKIMTGEGKYQVYAHPNARWLFDPKNLIYMETESHKKFRAILTPALFSVEALTQYAATQERVCREYMAKFAEECKNTGKPLEARVAFRKMAAASSQQSFLGPYLTPEQCVKLEQDIMEFTSGFLCFPFPYLGTGLWRAVQAKNRIEHVVEQIVPKAMEHVKNGGEVRCLIERWSVALLEEAKLQNVSNPNQLPYCDERNIGRTVLDFLFAAQDATNSALAYSLDVLDAHQDVLLKMRQEVLKECGGANSNHTIAEALHKKSDNASGLQYIERVSNQMLHHKPPVPMIPHLSLKSSELGGHGVPKSAICIPSIMYSARTSGASLKFLPDRVDQDTQFVKTVVFGGGQHKCPGRRYAESLLTVFLSILAQEYKFSRINSRPGPDDIMYYPTVFPVDCLFNFEHNPAKIQEEVAKESTTTSAVSATE
jgi:cytochrome P450